MVSEVDMFYPLPTKVTDFLPRPPTKQPPPVEEPEGPPVVEPVQQQVPSNQAHPGPAQPVPVQQKPPQSKPPTQILQDGDDNYNVQNPPPGEIYVTGPPRRMESSEYMNDLAYRNSPPHGYSSREQYYWRPPRPSQYPVSFIKRIKKLFSFLHSHAQNGESCAFVYVTFADVPSALRWPTKLQAMAIVIEPATASESDELFE